MDIDLGEELLRISEILSDAALVDVVRSEVRKATTNAIVINGRLASRPEYDVVVKCGEDSEAVGRRLKNADLDVIDISTDMTERVLGVRQRKKEK